MPEVTQPLYDSRAAIGTPIKLTRSFPAKANARENVPIPIIILYISALKNFIKMTEKIYQKNKLIIQNCKILLSIKLLIVNPSRISYVSLE